MNWFIPSWFGDLRLKPHPDDPKKTLFVCEDITADERVQLNALVEVFKQHGWLKKTPKPLVTPDALVILDLSAPIEEVGPVAVARLRPGPAVLTAVRLHNGQLEVCEHRGVGTEEELKELAKKEPEAAVTVKRPTPSCPECFIAGVAPATEVLLSFLDERQHETWAAGRYLVVRGGLTGHRYILAHRHSEIAMKNTRMCWDADDMDALHFHDWSVPPEEEVLAAMLCLRFREPWLRNTATCLGLRFRKVFDNPFGDHMEGVLDATLTRLVGVFGMAIEGYAPAPPPAPSGGMIVCRIDENELGNG